MAELEQVAFMSREQLDQLIAEEADAQAAEPTKDVPAAEEPKPASPEPEPEPNAEDKAAAPAEGNAPAGTDEPAKAATAPATDDELAKLRSEVEALRKKTTHESKFIDRLGTELGLLRKRTPEEEKARIQQLRDLFYEDPIEYQKQWETYKQEQEQMQRQERLERFVNYTNQNKAIITQKVPEIETAYEGLADILAEDGENQSFIEEFKQNPYIIPSATLYNMHKRKVLATEKAALAAEVESLKAQIEELKKKPDELVRNIEQAARKRPVSAGNGGAVGNSNTGVPANKPIAHMSKDELERVLKGG